jgi:hypothetical protein
MSDTLGENLSKPLPLYSKVMRRYVVQTSIELLRNDIRFHRHITKEKKKQLKTALDGVAHSGDVTLMPSDVFVCDKRNHVPDVINDPHEWERLLTHFEKHGLLDEGHQRIDSLIHSLRTRTNVISLCKEEKIPLPAGYDTDAVQSV